MFTRNTSFEAGRRICSSDAADYLGGSAPKTLRLNDASHQQLSGLIYIAGDSPRIQAPRPHAGTTSLTGGRGE